MYFDRNIIENKDGKKSEGSYLSCVMNGEFYFSKYVFQGVSNRCARSPHILQI